MTEPGDEKNASNPTEPLGTGANPTKPIGQPPHGGPAGQPSGQQPDGASGEQPSTPGQQPYGASGRPYSQHPPQPGQPYGQPYGQPGPQYGQSGQPGQPGQPYGQQYYGTPQGYYYPEQKSRLVGGLLGILLGGLGVHRFYLGHIGIGVLQIVVTFLTFGVGAVWGFIEGIMILVGAEPFKRDARGVPLKE
ncbi:TM2 domain-containing protein [Arthrobacter sulfonylureivorans]|uniref:NINE protein n=1 Tax=Arthrobacter sulfonylureivorans TaxID=2486855 RepID=A0ABY3W7C3_9MICC|nr:TM2 domain-containing protein [Arthrobacter sulfonylureivorans]UNK45382.1 NINE protein [Arthrobacter sulfonylureivorans]